MSMKNDINNPVIHVNILVSFYFYNLTEHSRICSILALYKFHCNVSSCCI